MINSTHINDRKLTYLTLVQDLCPDSKHNSKLSMKKEQEISTSPKISQLNRLRCRGSPSKKSKSEIPKVHDEWQDVTQRISTNLGWDSIRQNSNQNITFLNNAWFLGSMTNQAVDLHSGKTQPPCQFHRNWYLYMKRNLTTLNIMRVCDHQKDL